MKKQESPGFSRGEHVNNWMRRVHGWQRADRETICAPGGVVLRTIVHHPWSPKRGRR